MGASCTYIRRIGLNEKFFNVSGTRSEISSVIIQFVEIFLNFQPMILFILNVLQHTKITHAFEWQSGSVLLISWLLFSEIKVGALLTRTLTRYTCIDTVLSWFVEWIDCCKKTHWDIFWWISLSMILYMCFKSFNYFRISIIQLTLEELRIELETLGATLNQLICLFNLIN